MAEDRDNIELPESLRDVGQGERDSDPEIARKRAEGVTGEGIPTRTDMPDFTSGPGYTGQIPPEGTGEGDESAGSDVGRESGA
ncbi:MAG TPA: hypothetical protein VGP82_20630 [Ktedonobacterales bacterium]|nr:hypothetical protein [Ktedonobacterales bacterium]